MTEEVKDRFEKLSYRKVMFVHKPDKNHHSCFYIKGYENQESVGIITDHNTWDGKDRSSAASDVYKRQVDQFDRIEFLNK